MVRQLVTGGMPVPHGLLELAEGVVGFDEVALEVFGFGVHAAFEVE